MLIQNFLIDSAERFPDKTALVCRDERWTYAQLLEQGRRLAAGLLALGLERRDRVVVFCENSVEAVVSLYGTLMAGGTFVILNPAMKAKKLAYILNNSGSRVVIAQAAKAPVVREAASTAPEVRHLVWTGAAQPGVAPLSGSSTEHSWAAVTEGHAHGRSTAPSACIDIDLAAIIYTSGSTGEPKGVMSTHANMAAAARSITAYLENTPDDIILNTLPLSFDAYPFRVLETLVRERATGFPIVPTMAALLLQMQDLGRFDFSALRYITNTAAALPVPHIRRLSQLFLSVRIFSMYGLTECKRVAYMPPEELSRRPWSVGIPMPNCEVFIMDAEGRELGPNRVGELVVRGANVMQGYWRAPDETAERFRPGRYRGEVLLYSGDLFKRDAEGFLYFVARKDDMIKTKGERVSPKEIENVICELSGVAEAAVIGVPDEILGQAVKAFIVPSGGKAPTEKSILNHCKQNLEPFMVPKFIEFRSSLPHTDSGKVDKKPLK